jgi:hypothetical protein
LLDEGLSMRTILAATLAALITATHDEAKAKAPRRERGGFILGQHFGYSRLVDGGFDEALVHGRYPLIGASAAWEDEDDSWRAELSYGYEDENDVYDSKDYDATYRSTELRLSHGFGLDLDCTLFGEGRRCGVFAIRAEWFLGGLWARHHFEASDRYPAFGGAVARIEQTTTNLGGFTGLALTPRFGHPERLRGVIGRSRFLIEIPVRQTWTRQRVRADDFGLDQWVVQSTTTVGAGVAF